MRKSMGVPAQILVKPINAQKCLHYTKFHQNRTISVVIKVRKPIMPLKQSALSLRRFHERHNPQLSRTNPMARVVENNAKNITYTLKQSVAFTAPNFFHKSNLITSWYQVQIYCKEFHRNRSINVDSVDCRLGVSVTERIFMKLTFLRQIFGRNSPT
jgi:hypothetical protein